MRARARTTTGVTAVLALALALMLAGCGASAAKETPVISVFSPAIAAARAVPAAYTCDRRDKAPQIEWGPVPASTASLVLFVLGFPPKPVGDGYGVSVEWTVAGINPSLHQLDPQRLPAGAFVGVSTSGRRRYSLCPRKGVTEHYQFELWGLPERDTVSHNYAGAPVLKALLPHNGKTPASAHGGFTATYRRA